MVGGRGEGFLLVGAEGVVSMLEMGDFWGVGKGVVFDEDGFGF